MRPIRTYLFLACLLISTGLHAQTPDESSIFSSLVNFNAWIAKLTEEYEILLKSETHDECLRKLGYVGADLKYIRGLKERLLVEASKPDRNRNELTELMGALATATQELVANIRKMDVLINTNLGTYGNTNLNKLDYELMNEKRDSHIVMFEDLQSDHFKKFKKDAEYAISLLAKSEQLVWDLREKLSKETN
jgi:hypothetical protein